MYQAVKTAKTIVCVAYEPLVMFLNKFGGVTQIVECNYAECIILTIVQPVWYGRNCNTAFEHILLCAQKHCSYITTVTPTPYSDACFIQIAVFVQQVSAKWYMEQYCTKCSCNLKWLVMENRIWDFRWSWLNTLSGLFKYQLIWPLIGGPLFIINKNLLIVDRTHSRDQNRKAHFIGQDYAILKDVTSNIFE